MRGGTCLNHHAASMQAQSVTACQQYQSHSVEVGLLMEICSCFSLDLFTAVCIKVCCAMALLVCSPLRVDLHCSLFRTRVLFGQVVIFNLSPHSLLLSMDVHLFRQDLAMQTTQLEHQMVWSGPLHVPNKPLRANDSMSQHFGCQCLERGRYGVA